MASPLLADFGSRVRELREGRRWSQREFAERAGLTQKQVYDLESGQRDVRLSTIVQVVNALEVSAGDLIDDLRF